MKEVKIKFREKVGYGLGDAASSMFWKLFGMYLLYFYTDIFGIPAAVVGTMFLITRIWDSLNDPLAGIIADRTRSRFGKFRPYLLWGAVPFGLMGVLTFSTPDFGMTGKVVYAYVTYTLMMMLYTLVNVPYASLLGVMSDNPRERTELSSYRMIFAFIGSILVLLLVEPLVDLFSRTDTGVDLARGWQRAVIVFAMIAVVFFLVSFLWTKERVQPIARQKNSLKDDFRDLLRNRPWWILLGAGIAALIFNSIRDGAAVYYFKYYVENTGQKVYVGLGSMTLTLTTIYLVLGQAANILGILLAAPVSNRFGKKWTYLGAMALAGLFSVGFFFLGNDDIGLMMVMQFLISACAGSIFPLLWSMYADIADYSELRTGRRATGLIFSSSSMSQKFGWTIGGALTGWLLAYFGFQANVEQSAEAQNGIRMMLSILPAVGALLSVLFVAFYPLNERQMEAVESELKTLRNETER